jgi:Putative peptidoglycan binding domain
VQPARASGRFVDQTCELRLDPLRRLNAGRLDYRFGPRLLGELVLVAALALGGYLIGRSSAPNCAPVPDAHCIEAQASAPVAPTPVAPTPEASAPQATAPLAPTPPVPTPPVAPSVSAPEVTKANPPSTPTGGTRPLSNDEVRETQAWLKAFGFDPGPLDGFAGSRTMAAVKRYQATRQAEETGLLNRSLLRQVRKDAGQS